MFKGIKTIDDFNFKSKRVLLRIDINSPVKGKRVMLSKRIKESSRTIKELKKKRARVVLLAHQSRPGKKDFISLKQHAKLLSRFTEVNFVRDVMGKKAINAITKLKDGEVLLLDNVRFVKEEFNPSKKNKLVRKLLPFFDIYLNDAFSVSHRKHTSVVSFARVLDSGIGRVMEHELRSLDKVSLKIDLFILAGGKIEELISLLNNLPSNSNVLACGLFGQTCVIGKGYDLGRQNTVLKEQLKYLPKLKRHLRKIETPVDFAVKVKGERVELKLEDFPSRRVIFDIGKETIRKYIKSIRKAGNIFMKGSAGYCEDPMFCKGTIRLLKEISKRPYSVVGGGHLTSIMKRLNISENKFNLVSLSGGALVDYISGKKLPGIEVLK